MADHTKTSADSSNLLPMGTTPDGRTVRLNLATGNVELCGAPTPNTQLLPAEAFTPDAVAAIFRGAGYAVEVDEEGDVVINDGGTLTFITLPDNGPLLRFWQVMEFNETHPEAVQLAWTNHLNTESWSGSFCRDGDNMLVHTHDLVLAAGMSPAQLLANYRFRHEELGWRLKTTVQLDLLRGE